MTDQTELARRFDEHRDYLLAVAQRIVGVRADAQDAVQETWLRLSRSGDDDLRNLRAWLTTATSRICLDQLRRRAVRAEDLVDVTLEVRPAADDADSAEESVLRAESLRLALQVVVSSLSPAERVTFVLHDLFDVPLRVVAGVLDRTPAATKQLASRARGRIRVQPAQAGTHADRAVTDAFFAAARSGRLDDLTALLDPSADLRVLAAHAPLVRGSQAVAAQAARFARPEADLVAVGVDGGPGAVVVIARRAVSVLAFTVRDGRITQVRSVSGAAVRSAVPAWLTVTA